MSHYVAVCYGCGTELGEKNCPVCSAKKRVKCFEVHELKWNGLEYGENQKNEWILSGRAIEDLHVGDWISFGGQMATITKIVTYGKSIEFLNKVMSGHLYILFPGGDTHLSAYEEKR